MKSLGRADNAFHKSSQSKYEKYPELQERNDEALNEDMSFKTRVTNVIQSSSVQPNNSVNMELISSYKFSLLIETCSNNTVLSP